MPIDHTYRCLVVSVLVSRSWCLGPGVDHNFTVRALGFQSRGSPLALAPFPATGKETCFVERQIDAQWPIRSFAASA